MHLIGELWLLFHAAFDGTAEATRANGSPTPCRAEGLSFAEGRIGQAVRLNRAARSALAYAAKDNLVPERGTVAFWFRREWPDRGRTPQGGAIWRTLFANPPPKGDRIGSGQLWFWLFGGTVRADLSDNEDRYAALIRNLSAFRYCLTDAAGKAVVDFGDVSVGETAAQLPFRLPAGEYALRVTDGTNAYGNVPVVVLPATVMRDVAAIGDVRVRQGAFGGEIYFYVVNTGLKPARVTLDFPAKTRNLVTGEVFKGGLFGLKGETRALDLAPYELRSFSAPRGNVRLSR